MADEATGTIELSGHEIALVVRGLHLLYSKLPECPRDDDGHLVDSPEWDDARATAALWRRLGREDPTHEVFTTEAEVIAHILSAHQMGAGGARVETDDDMIDVWGEIQDNPAAWHDADHEAFGPGHDSGWH